MLKKLQVFAYSLLFISSFVMSSFVMAGTVIQIQDNNDLTTMMTDGNKARINMSADEYVIVDFDRSEVNVINTQQKQVISSGTEAIANRRSGSNNIGVKMRLKQLGAGINIAGYQTQKYQYFANGRSCGVVYASQSAYQEKGVKELLRAMQAMIDKQRALLGGFASLLDDCKLADMQLTDKVNSIGVPMRTEENGRVETQVKSIQINAVLPDDTFIIPASYTSMTMPGQVQKKSNNISL